MEGGKTQNTYHSLFGRFEAQLRDRPLLSSDPETRSQYLESFTDAIPSMNVLYVKIRSYVASGLWGLKDLSRSVMKRQSNELRL